MGTVKLKSVLDWTKTEKEDKCAKWNQMSHNLVLLKEFPEDPKILDNVSSFTSSNSAE